MQQESAQVTNIEGDYAFLKASRNSSCGSCSSKGSCGSFKLINSASASNPLIKVKNTLNLNAGDIVQLDFSSSRLIQGTLLVYIIPILSLFVFAIIAKLIIGEGASIVAGLAGLFIALFIVKKFISQENISTQFTPNVSIVAKIK